MFLSMKGSDSTAMTSSCASRLQLRGEPQILEVDGVGSEIRQCVPKRIQFMLCSESGELLQIETSLMKKVSKPATVVDWCKKKLLWPHLAYLPVNEVEGDLDCWLRLNYDGSAIQKNSERKSSKVVRHLIINAPWNWLKNISANWIWPIKFPSPGVKENQI